jgi:purine catabolism regulator
MEFAPSHPDVGGRSLVLPVGGGPRGAAQAWLVAVRDSDGLGDFERLILQQAVTVVALELMRQRAMRDTERRLAGDVLAEAVEGRLAEHELPSRLLPFGVGQHAAVLVFDAPAAAEGDLQSFLRDEGLGALVATNGELLCAVVDAAEELDTVALAERAGAALGETRGPVRAGASRIAAVETLRRTFHEARCALEAMKLANSNGRTVASWRDLGAFQLLLSLQDDEALRLYCDSVLGPLEDESQYGDELIRSLEAFIEQNGQWERAARKLFCHRHTLRYRIRRVEALTGRDLSSARDRIEFWLALRGRELVS